MPNVILRIERELSNVSKGDLTEIKAFTNPPKAVIKAFEAVHVLKTGQKADWGVIKKSLANPN